ALRTRLLPAAGIVTPNIPEAELLLGRPIAGAADAEAALDALLALGADAVLLKGGHLDEGDQVIDRYADATTRRAFRSPRLRVDGHGTGCTLASAIAANLCRGMDMAGACEQGVAYIRAALRAGIRPGHSEVLVLGHFAARRDA